MFHDVTKCIRKNVSMNYRLTVTNGIEYLCFPRINGSFEDDF